MIYFWMRTTVASTIALFQTGWQDEWRCHRKGKKWFKFNLKISFCREKIEKELLRNYFKVGLRRIRFGKLWSSAFIVLIFGTELCLDKVWLTCTEISLITQWLIICNQHHQPATTIVDDIFLATFLATNNGNLSFWKSKRERDKFWLN